MIQIAGIDHLVIRVGDVERMIDFYTRVVGCTLEKRVDRIGLVHLRAGSALVDLDYSTPYVAASDSKRNLAHFCVRIDPFDEVALRAHFEGHGVALSKLFSNYGAEGVGPSLYFDDPEGNTIELKGPPEGAR